MKKSLLIIPACWMAAACATHEPQLASSAPPRVTYTVDGESYIDEADQRAVAYCTNYGRRAVRTDVSHAGRDLAVSYECR